MYIAITPRSPRMDEMYGVEGNKPNPDFVPRPGEYRAVGHQTTAQPPSEAAILEEMCQLKELNPILFSGAVLQRVTGSEATVLMRKKTAGMHGLGGGSRVFPISDTANEDDIARWMNHPDMDGTKLGDRTVVDMAAHTPMPTTMMRGILIKLLRSDYESYYRKAELSVKQRKR